MCSIERFGLLPFLTLLFAMILGGAVPASADDDVYTFVPVYFDGTTYCWGFVHSPDFETSTSNWTGPDLFPGSAGATANIIAPVNGVTNIGIYGYVFEGSIPVPADYIVGVLNLNAGPNGGYHFVPVQGTTSYLRFDNLQSAAQLNVTGNDAGDDVISSGVAIAASGLDITGNSLAIAGPIIGGRLDVDCAVLTLSGVNSNSRTVLHTGTVVNLLSTRPCAANGVIQFQGGALNLFNPTNISQYLAVDAGGGRLTLPSGAHGATLITGGFISSDGTLTVDGGGTLIFEPINPYDGGLLVHSSTLTITDSVGLGSASGRLYLNSSTLGVDAFRPPGTYSVNKPITLSGGSGFSVTYERELVVGGVIDGSGGLTVLGGGTVVLTNQNSFRGDLKITGGSTLRVLNQGVFGNAANSIVLDGGTLNLGNTIVSIDNPVSLNNGTIDVDGDVLGMYPGLLFINSQITGHGLTKTGFGDLVLAHANSFASPVAINGGHIFVSADNQLGDPANSLSFDSGGLVVTGGFATSRALVLNEGGGVIEVRGLVALTAGGQLTGTGALTKSGLGTLVLANAGNNYGDTVISEGTVRIAAGAALGTANQTLTLSGFSGNSVLNTTASITMSRPINLTAGHSTFDVNPGTTLTLDGVISGDGGFVKTDTGNLVLGGANAYAGATTINQGTLLTAAVNCVPSASAVSLGGGTLFNLGGHSQIIGSLTGQGNVTNSGSVGSDTLAVGADNTSPPAFSGVLSDGPAGRTLGLSKVGNGSLILAGANTYSGPTTVFAGTLTVSGSIANSSVTVSPGSNLNLVGGAITGPVVNNGSAMFNGGPITTNGDVTNAAGKSIDIADSAATFAGNVTNNGTFRTTNATTSFAGNFTNNGIFTSDPSTQNFQNLTIGANGALVGGLGDVFNVRGDLINNSVQNVVWDTHLAQIGFNATGPHQLTWTGTEQGRGNAGFVNNFATGIFVLPSGASMTTGGGALYTRVLTLGDGLTQISSITGSGLNIHYNPGSPQNAYLNFQSYALPNGHMISPAAAPADINAVWNGTTGTWTDASRWSSSPSYPLNLSSSVTLYDATINSGTVTLNQTIGYLQKLNLGSGGTLTGAASVTPWDTFTWGTISNAGASMVSGGSTVNANGDIAIVGDSARNLDNATINNHSGCTTTWTAGNSDVNFSNMAVFNNDGSFFAQNNRGLGHNGGTGTFNNNGTFTKNTGTLTTNVGSANFTFNNPGALVVSTGTLQFDGPLMGPASGSISVASGASLVFGDVTSQFAGSITNAGPLNVGDAIGAANSAELRLQANSQINNSSVLTVKGDGLLDVNGFTENVGALEVNRGNIAIGVGALLPSSLSMAGGTITSTGIGKMQLSSGVTAASDGGGSTATISAQVDLNGATRTFAVNHGAGATDLLISGAISNGGLTKTGLGTATLTAANVYAGGTTMQAGVLNIDGSNAIGSGSFTVSGGTIDNTTAGPLKLATNNTQFWAGNVAFAGTQSLDFGSGAVTLNSNPIVTVTANTLTVGPIVNGTGNSLTKAGAGILFVNGGASYTGATFVNVGTLVISAGPFASSASTVATAAVMNFVNGANAGSGTFTNNGSASSAIAGGLVQFADSGTSAGFGVYTNKGGSGATISSTGSNGAQMIFNSGASAGNATITNSGASSKYAGTGAQLFFNNGSTAANANITTNGGNGVDTGGGAAPNAVTLFSGNANAGTSTLITNAGTFTGGTGLTEFINTSSSANANITINSGYNINAVNLIVYNKWLNSATAGAATISINSLAVADFENTATAGSATLIIKNGGLATFIDHADAGNASVAIGPNAQTQFHNNASAGTASITFTPPTGGGQGPTSFTRFFDSADAGSATITVKGQQFGIGCFTEFHNSSSAASAFINNNGGSAGGASGGETDFYDTSSAGSAIFVQGGSNTTTANNGGVAQFFNTSKAGTANFTNNPATTSGGNNGGGYVYFNNGTSADHATITNNGSAVTSSAQTNGGHTVFFGGSTADHAAITNNGALNSTSQPGETDITGGAITGSATFTNNASAVSGAPGGKTVLSGSPGNLASAGSATFISNGGTVSGALGGVANLSFSSTGGTATFIANGGNGAGTLGGTTLINNADAANATLIANSGTNGGAGGNTRFASGSTGGAARVITNSGGIFEISIGGSPLTVGSIEGAGQFQLGGSILSVGGLNTDTAVSGTIVGPASSGITKQGTGKLTLSGVDTYTGPTTVNGGTLAINGSITSPVTVNTGAALKGTGTITGSVSIAAGGTIAPGDSPGILRVASLSLATNSTTAIELGGTARGNNLNNYDAIIATGSVALGGTLQVSLVNGFNPIAGASFDILDWGTRSGTFSALQLPAGGITWDTSQLYTTGVLTVLSSGLAGDYNQNGIVDAADYVVWRKALGTTYAQADYGVWRSHFGQTAGTGAGVGTTSAVPEPASVLLSVLGLLATFSCRGRQSRRPLTHRKC